MEEKNQALFLELGVDIPTAKERFMDNEELYFRFLYKIIDNQQFKDLKQAIAQDDRKEALMLSHNLKSFCGNLSLTKLYELLTLQVQHIREDNWDSAVALLDDISSELDRVVTLLKRENPTL